MKITKCSNFLIMIFGLMFIVALTADVRAEIVVELPSSPNPVGSGARALGMGGAFIAVADDATAASWNPGGLIQLEKPECSVVLGRIDRDETLRFGAYHEANGGQSIDDLHVNYLSVAYPFTVDHRNMIVSLNYQRQYDFNRTWWSIRMDDTGFSGVDYKWDYQQEGELYALGLAYAVELSPRFSLGLTLNYWGDFINNNQWNQKYEVKHTDSIVIPFVGTWEFTLTENREQEYDFKGWNANVGFLFNFAEKWTLGGVLKTPFSADVDHRQLMSSNVTTETKDELDMPMSYGLGLAYRASDNFTVSADFYITEWSEVEYKPETGESTSPVSGKPYSESDIDDTAWFRLGAEYSYIGKTFAIPFRCGIFYDPAPAEGSEDGFNGFALGTGVAYRGFIWDIAYQYRSGDDVGESFLEEFEFSEDVRERILYSSLILHF